jgi:hypothetical protein
MSFYGAEGSTTIQRPESNTMGDESLVAAAQAGQDCQPPPRAL